MECPYCTKKNLWWTGQFTTDDIGFEGGAVERFDCPDCGCIVLCIIPDEMPGERGCEAYLLDDGAIQCGDWGNVMNPPFPMWCPECEKRVDSIVAEGE